MMPAKDDADPICQQAIRIGHASSSIMSEGAA
jgi:hypothetical protein